MWAELQPDSCHVGGVRSSHKRLGREGGKEGGREGGGGRGGGGEGRGGEEGRERGEGGKGGFRESVCVCVCVCVSEYSFMCMCNVCVRMWPSTTRPWKRSNVVNVLPSSEL